MLQLKSKADGKDLFKRNSNSQMELRGQGGLINWILGSSMATAVPESSFVPLVGVVGLPLFESADKEGLDEVLEKPTFEQAVLASKVAARMRVKGKLGVIPERVSRPRAYCRASVRRLNRLGG